MAGWIESPLSTRYYRFVVKYGRKRASDSATSLSNPQNHSFGFMPDLNPLALKPRRPFVFFYIFSNP